MELRTLRVTGNCKAVFEVCYSIPNAVPTTESISAAATTTESFTAADTTEPIPAFATTESASKYYSTVAGTTLLPTSSVSLPTTIQTKAQVPTLQATKEPKAHLTDEETPEENNINYQIDGGNNITSKTYGIC